jgi:hypothetical protein
VFVHHNNRSEYSVLTQSGEISQFLSTTVTTPLENVDILDFAYGDAVFVPVVNGLVGATLESVVYMNPSSDGWIIKHQKYGWVVQSSFAWTVDQTQGFESVWTDGLFHLLKFRGYGVIDAELLCSYKDLPLLEHEDSLDREEGGSLVEYNIPLNAKVSLEDSGVLFKFCEKHLKHLWNMINGVNVRKRRVVLIPLVEDLKAHYMGHMVAMNRARDIANRAKDKIMSNPKWKIVVSMCGYGLDYLIMSAVSSVINDMKLMEDHLKVQVMGKQVTKNIRNRIISWVTWSGYTAVVVSAVFQFIKLRYGRKCFALVKVLMVLWVLKHMKRRFSFKPVVHVGGDVERFKENWLDLVECRCHT